MFYTLAPVLQIWGTTQYNVNDSGTTQTMILGDCLYIPDYVVQHISPRWIGAETGNPVDGLYATHTNTALTAWTPGHFIRLLWMIKWTKPTSLGSRNTRSICRKWKCLPMKTPETLSWRSKGCVPWCWSISCPWARSNLSHVNLWKI